MPAEDEEETLHSCRPSTYEYVSLLPSEAEGKKLVIEDCFEVLKEELIRGVSCYLRGAPCCCCVGAEVCLLEG